MVTVARDGVLQIPELLQLDGRPDPSGNRVLAALDDGCHVSARNTEACTAPITPLQVLKRYLAISVIINLAWETAQLPLYAIWFDGSVRELVWAVLHCTAGDAIIATGTLIVGLVIAGRGWPGRRYWIVTFLTIAAGVGYLIFSEWLNVVVRQNWAYAPAMPILPYLGTGLAPLAQWLVVPALSFALARPRQPIGPES